MKKKVNKSIKAFTLVELLATIVILGVLLLIAVPSINGVINRSKQETFLTDAKMYMNAAKLQAASLAKDKKSYVFEIEDIETEKGNTNYSGRILAIKNDSTGEYDYSIFMVDENTHQAIGKLEGTIPTYAKEISRQNISKVDELAYNEHKINVGLGLTSFYIEGDDVKKRITRSGNLFSLKNSMIKVSQSLYSMADVTLETKEYGNLGFKLLNDEGYRMLLLYEPVSLNDIYQDPSVMKYADSNSDGRSDIQDYMDKYKKLNVKDSNGTEKEEHFNIRLLAINDLFQVFKGTDSSIDGIKKLFQQNERELRNRFKTSGLLTVPKNYVPTLLIDAYNQGACTLYGEITTESNPLGTECYGLNIVDAAFKDPDCPIITPHSGKFFVRIVMQVEGNQRQYFTSDGERLENYE